MEDANEIVNLGCTFIKLSIIILSLDTKCFNKVTDNAFDMLVDFLRELLSIMREKLPKLFYVT